LTLDATPTPVVATWASGDANYKKTIEADLTLDISGYADGTYYAYLDYNSGTPVLSAVNLVPTDGYGVASTTNNQHHFRIPEMKMYVGDGSAYAEALHLFVGEFTVASNVISGTPVTYALRGEYVSAGGSVPAINTRTQYTHAIGSKSVTNRGYVRCVQTERGYAAGETIELFHGTHAGSNYSFPLFSNVNNKTTDVNMGSVFGLMQTGTYQNATWNTTYWDFILKVTRSY
jgi:hypothetical protein